MSQQLSTKCLSQSSDHNPAVKPLFPPLNFSDPLAMAPNHRELSAVASEELNYRLIDTFFSLPPPFLPVSRSCRIHSRLPPLKGKPSKKDEFVLTIPAHSITDKQLFFFSGKEDFPVFTYSKEAAPVRSRATQKSFRSLFCCHCRHRRRRWRERKKKKGARLSWRGRKDFPSPGTFKANLVTARSKNTPGNTTSQSGGRETVTSFSSHCFLRSATRRHRSVH